MGLFSWLWGMARGWPDPGMGIRPGSANAVFVTFLILLFTLIGIVLALMGFDIADVEAWLDAHGGLFDAIGTVLFKILLGFILLICVFTIAGAIFDRRNPERPGVIMSIVAALIGYFCAVGLFN